jgi:glucokinase
MSAPETIGVDLGGTKMLVGVAVPEREILYRRQEVSLGLDQEGVLEELEEELHAALAARPNAAAAGLGVPCTIDRERGLAITAVNLPIQNVPIRDLMRERLGIPVFLDNDANLAALAEHRFGAARGARNAVLLTIGTGIGGGLIIDGELYHGSIGAAAELGHAVIEVDGPPCQGNCPGHGCVESLASGTALAREAREMADGKPGSVLGDALAQGRTVDGKLVTEAALDGDEVARRAVELIGRRLGAALAGFANIFNPDVMILGGGVVAGAGELLLDPARDEVRTRALPPMNAAPVVAAELGAEAGMIGAATMARIELERQPRLGTVA